MFASNEIVVENFCVRLCQSHSANDEKGNGCITNTKNGKVIKLFGNFVKKIVRCEKGDLQESFRVCGCDSTLILGRKSYLFVSFFLHRISQDERIL